MDAADAWQVLAAERKRLEHALLHRRHEDDGEQSDPFTDWANLAANLYQDELDESFADDLRARLAAVERAERRLIAGTYGLSIVSGTRIPDERLEVLPTAERTVEEERERGAHRP